MSFEDLKAFIQDTIAAQNTMFCQNKDYLCHVLEVLKVEVASSDKLRDLTLE